MAKPYKVPPGSIAKFVVHHLDWDNANVAASNLAPMLVEHHRSQLLQKVIHLSY